MASFTITEPERPECYDELKDLTEADWQTLTALQVHETEPTVSASSADKLREMGLLTKELRLTEQGRLAYRFQHDFAVPWDYENDGSIWKSCAVVATDGKGNDVLLHAFGPAFDWHIEQYGHTCDAICLDGYTEPGVWVFEGSCGSVPHETMDGTEYDLESHGEWREPTEEEWEMIRQDECPWDKETLPRWPERKDQEASLDDLLRDRWPDE